MKRLTKKKQSSIPFVNWFRDSSPYINAFRGKTFVIAFDGQVLSDQKFSKIFQDISLLNSLGIKLVLIHGIRPQIEKRLRARKARSQYFNGVRITDDDALICAQEASGAARITIEALLSMGLANTPMAGSDNRVISGNFITACPLGVTEGIDYQHTGKVRRIDHHGIQQSLTENTIVLLSPIGYSPTGEFFNLTALEVASATAIALQADKLILLVDSKGLRLPRHRLARELTLTEAKKIIAGKKRLPEDVSAPLRQAYYASSKGVRRSHLIDHHIDGALLLELFTRDGCGSMIFADQYEGIRQATIDDVGGIIQLVSPLEELGVLVKWPREKLEINIDKFSIVERDGMVIACAAIYPLMKGKIAEICCLAVRPEYQGMGYGSMLLSFLEKQAETLSISQFFILTTQAMHWFQEQGFHKTDLKSLPVKRRSLYNYQRNSKILIKGDFTS